MRSDDTDAVEARLVDARRAGWPSARLYALLDPLLPAHEGLAPMLERRAGRVALFDQTVDAEVAEGGPWLVELDAANAELVSGLLALGRDPQGVVWLISERDPPGLAQALRERLNVRLEAAAPGFHEQPAVKAWITRSGRSASQRFADYLCVVRWRGRAQGANKE